MIHPLCFALCLAGFAALALATHRQQREIIGRSLHPHMKYMLRAAGACALLFALGVLVASQGWGLGLVMFSGHTSLAAGIIYCAILGYTGIYKAGRRAAASR